MSDSTDKTIIKLVKFNTGELVNSKKVIIRKEGKGQASALPSLIMFYSNTG